MHPLITVIFPCVRPCYEQQRHIQLFDRFKKNLYFVQFKYIRWHTVVLRMHAVVVWVFNPAQLATHVQHICRMYSVTNVFMVVHQYNVAILFIV